MFWIIFTIAVILLLAYWLRKAAKGTPFERKMACTPRIEQLRHLEDPEYKAKKENLW